MICLSAWRFETCVRIIYATDHPRTDREVCPVHYTTEITIDLPRDRMIALFDNPDNMAGWMQGLQSFEHLSGDLGQPGAKSRLVFDEGGRVIEMVETITVRNLPDEFSATYEAKNVWNGAVNRFYEDGPNRTRWVAEHEFKFSGFMRVIAFFMRGAFPKQTLTHMQHFKTFAESAE